jgi:hypothetical protein
MKHSMTLLLLVLITTVASAQFSKSTGVTTNLAAAIEWGKSQSANSITAPLSFSSRTLEQKERAVAQLHGKLFNLAQRDQKLETQVAETLLPVLSQLGAQDKIAILVVKDDIIPYARLTSDGVFVMTSCLAKGDFVGLQYRKSFFLRELVRLSLINEFGQAVAKASANDLQLVDLKITAGAALLANVLEVQQSDLRGAIVQYATRAPGTQSTYQTDQRLFPREFAPQQAGTTPKGLSKLIGLAKQLEGTQSTPASLRSVDDLHTRGNDIAPTSDHEKVIAYFFAR